MTEQLTVATAPTNPAAVAPDPDAWVALVERAARDPSVDIAKLQQLLSLRAQEEARRAERAYRTAMSHAQAALDPVRADCRNDQTRSKYASLGAIDAEVRPVMARYGLSLSFNTATSNRPDCVRVLCMVSHEAGHTETFSIDMPADGLGPKGQPIMSKTHSVGSAVSYGRRYLISMVFSLSVDKDDDGNGASRRPQQTRPYRAGEFQAPQPGRTFTPKPNPMQHIDPATGEITDAGRELTDWADRLSYAARQGMSALKDTWERMPPEFRKPLIDVKNRLKPMAEEADQLAPDVQETPQ